MSTVLAVLIATLVIAPGAGASRGAGRPPAPAARSAPAARATAGGFTVSHGQIIGPSGRVFIVRGINASSPTQAGRMLALFPGIDFVRFASPHLPPPGWFAPFIATMTAHHVVVEIEHHPWPLIDALTGVPLAREAAWYGRLAAAYRTDPYVWFGSMNEPQGGNITAQQVATYRAVRGAGAANMILLEAGLGAGNPGDAGPGSLDPAPYAAMTNIAWDLHFYGWVSDYSTDQTTVDHRLLGSAATDTGILGAQQIDSADGVVPVVNAEFGVSTDGKRFDANDRQDIDAVTRWAVTHHYTSGFSGWHWNSDPFNSLQVGGTLTWWGRQLAAAIARVAR